MAKRPEFTLVFAPEALEHLDGIEAKHHSLLRRSMAEQLKHQPTVATKNRKPLTQPAPFEASWELRCGPDNRFRVFYDVCEDALEVQVLVIGVKDRNKLRFGNEEYAS